MGGGMGVPRERVNTGEHCRSVCALPRLWVFRGHYGRGTKDSGRGSRRAGEEEAHGLAAPRRIRAC